MTVAQLIEELKTLPQYEDVLAGEWVSPSQLGEAVVKVCADYCSGGVPRIHIFAPRPEIFEDTE